MIAIGRRYTPEQRGLGWRLPIVLNWKGVKIHLANVNQDYILKTMGPNSPSRCNIVVKEIREEDETILVLDQSGKEMLLTWDEWAWMQPKLGHSL